MSRRIASTRRFQGLGESGVHGTLHDPKPESLSPKRTLVLEPVVDVCVSNNHLSVLGMWTETLSP